MKVVNVEKVEDAVIGIAQIGIYPNFFFHLVKKNDRLG